MVSDAVACAVCGYGGRLGDTTVTETDDAGDVVVVVQNVPAEVCDTCGTVTLFDDVARRFEQIVELQQAAGATGAVVVDYAQHPYAVTG